MQLIPEEMLDIPYIHAHVHVYTECSNRSAPDSNDALSDRLTDM